MHLMDGYTILDYGRMILDQRRTKPFVDALLRAVKPGSVVLDMGTGPGYFALLAIQAGAARVYAVEPDDAIEVARRCAAKLPGGERITFIQGLTTELDLPEKVDVVIGDLHGVVPFYTANLVSMIDARKRHLKPGGQIIPARDRMFLVPAQAPDEYQNLQEPWLTNAHGLDLSAGRQYVSNTWWRVNGKKISADALLAKSLSWGTIDYGSTESTDLEDTLRFPIERAGTMHGYYLWFDGEMDDSAGYSNAPDLPELVYGRAYVPLEQAVDVVPGDEVSVLFGARFVKGDYVYRWDTRITDASGAVKGEFRQSTFKADILIPDRLKKAAVDYVPSLNTDGEILRYALQAMADATPSRYIAVGLADRFPQRFRDEETALREVVKLASKYG